MSIGVDCKLYVQHSLIKVDISDVRQIGCNPDKGL